MKKHRNDLVIEVIAKNNVEIQIDTTIKMNIWIKNNSPAIFIDNNNL